MIESMIKCFSSTLKDRFLQHLSRFKIESTSRSCHVAHGIIPLDRDAPVTSCCRTRSLLHVVGLLLCGGLLHVAGLVLWSGYVMLCCRTRACIVEWLRVAGLVLWSGYVMLCCRTRACIVEWLRVAGLVLWSGYVMLCCRTRIVEWLRDAVLQDSSLYCRVATCCRTRIVEWLRDAVLQDSYCGVVT